MSPAMRIEPYLCFDGDGEEAFALYAQCLGGTLRPIFRVRRQHVRRLVERPGG